MSKHTSAAEAEFHLQQAAEWLTKLNSGEFSTDDERELNAWRAANPGHELAWRKVQSTWRVMDVLTGSRIPGSEPLRHERQRRISKGVRFGQQRGSRAVALAACLLIAVSLIMLNPPFALQADVMTGKGEQRTITLADNSQVMLNTGTALALRYSDKERRLELLDGEAFFKVAKGKAQPFVVGIAGNEVRAIGTAFNVRREPGGVEVELVEGIVELQYSENQRRTRLKAGESARVSSQGIAVKKHLESDMALWRDGYLAFDRLPLSDAIAQINRYRTGRIILLNNRYAGHRVSGLFRLNALDQAVDSLKAVVPGIKLRSITPYLIVLS